MTLGEYSIFDWLATILVWRVMHSNGLNQKFADFKISVGCREVQCCAIVLICKIQIKAFFEGTFQFLQLIGCCHATNEIWYLMFSSRHKMIHLKATNGLLTMLYQVKTQPLCP